MSEEEEITSRDLTKGRRLRFPKNGLLTIIERANGKIYLEDGTELRVAAVVRDINKGLIEYMGWNKKAELKAPLLGLKRL